MVLVFLLDVVLLLIGLGGTPGLFAVLSITVIGYQISYAIPLLLRVTSGRADFKQNPEFSLGAWSLPIHAVAGVWLVFTSLIFFWPSSWPVCVTGTTCRDANGDAYTATSEQDNMNYTVVVVGAAFVLSALWWVCAASKTYKGPAQRAGEVAKAATVELRSPAGPTVTV